MFTWHVAITHQFCELRAESELTDIGIQPFNPRCEVVRIQRGRERITRSPYIPGYIFARFDMSEDLWLNIKSRCQRSIKHLIANTNGRPSVVPDPAMKVLLDKCDGHIVRADEVDRAMARFLPVGANVGPKDGPFADLVGKVKWSDKERTEVFMFIMGRETAVRFKTKDLALVG